MRLRSTIRVFASFLTAAAMSLPALALAQTASAASGSVCVNSSGSGGCYSSIGKAISAAAPGAVISVAAGTYKESVAITTPVTLQGAGASSTIIDATGLKNGITVTGSGPVMISGFTVQNAQYEGILLNKASQVTVTSNIVQNNDTNLKAAQNPQDTTCPGAMPLLQMDCGEGLHLMGATDSKVMGNVVQGNAGGILLSDETGPVHDNVISGNTVQNNKLDCGITLASHPAGFGPKGPLPGAGVYNNSVTNNLVSGNGAAGVGMYTPTPGTATYNNTVTGNTITDNGLPGVAMHSHSPGANLNGNVITDNYISGNGFDPEARQAPPDKTGIAIFSDDKAHADPITGTVVARNMVANEAIGVFVGYVAIDQALDSNSLAGNSVGVKNAGTGTVNAASNYWGCAAGPGSSGCATVAGSVKAGSPLAAAVMPKAPMFLAKGATVTGSLANQTGGASVVYAIVGDGAVWNIALNISGVDANTRLAGMKLSNANGVFAQASMVNNGAVIVVPTTFGQMLTLQLYNFQPNTAASYTLTTS